MAPPSDVTSGLTISSVKGQVITLNTNPGSASQNQWAGGVLTITSGSGNGYKAVIAANASNTLYISAPFDGDITIAVGDSCTVTKGPLGAARVLAIEGNNVKAHIDAGIDYFVHIAIPEYGVAHKGLGRQNNSIQNQERYYDFQLFVEAPLNSTVATTAAEAFEALTDIYTLVEQVMTRIHAFRSLPNISPIEDSGTVANFYLADREGGQKVRLGVVEFSVITHF